MSYSDCSDIVTKALEVGENSEGEELKTDEPIIPCAPCELPLVKHGVIETRNDGIDYDELNGITPSDEAKKPKPNEKKQKKN